MNLGVSHPPEAAVLQLQGVRKSFNIGEPNETPGCFTTAGGSQIVQHR